jgi:hypothetical protein
MIHSRVQEVDVQLYVLKRLSMDRLSAAIMRVHAENGCSEPLSWDTFRKRLGQATQQLGYILQRCDDMKGLGAEDYPSGLLAECGGCWTAAEADQVMLPPSLSAQFLTFSAFGAQSLPVTGVYAVTGCSKKSLRHASNYFCVMLSRRQMGLRRGSTACTLTGVSRYPT